MILKRKLIISVLINILNLTSGDSGCEDNGEKISFRPDYVPLNSGNTADGYSVEWYTGIVKKGISGWSSCPDKVTFYYNGPPDTKCCYGYQEVSKYPKTEGVGPFILPGLCGDNSEALTYITFDHWGLTMEEKKFTLKDVRSCNPGSLGDDAIIPVIICGSVLTLILVIGGVFFFRKKDGNNEDDEPTEYNDGEPAYYEPAHYDVEPGHYDVEPAHYDEEPAYYDEEPAHYDEEPAFYDEEPEYYDEERPYYDDEESADSRNSRQSKILQKIP